MTHLISSAACSYSIVYGSHSLDYGAENSASAFSPLVDITPDRQLPIVSSRFCSGKIIDHSSETISSTLALPQHLSVVCHSVDDHDFCLYAAEYSRPPSCLLFAEFRDASVLSQQSTTGTLLAAYRRLSKPNDSLASVALFN